ncbi:MAG: DNA/RNA helicase [Gammaproteobacteria bacterium]|nr:DNA/RNA helicase [Gammaproteobacteria bacterium]
MIELLGQDGTSEFEAARSIRDALVKLWPGVEAANTTDDQIKIIAGAKISGYRVSDIDVVVCAKFRSGRKFMPKRALTDNNSVRIINRPVSVTNLMVAIEIKDHGASGVRFTGDNIEVKYSRIGPVAWKSATDQNINQVHSLREYFSDQQLDLYIHRLVILRGLDQIKCNGALTKSFSGADFLTAIAATSHIFKRGNEYTLSSGTEESIRRALNAPLFRRLIPSSLDRKKMDRIATRSSMTSEWQGLPGTKLLRFRGRGGSGKTILLLQMAWREYEEKAARTLVLTYNHALAADVSRLMALLGIPATPDDGGIAVETVMSFMFSWFSRLQLLDENNEMPLEQYDKYCSSAAEMLKVGAITHTDLEAIKASDPDRFDFDYIFVDEAQDWPANEIETLKLLYGPKRIWLADGVDQLIRGERANWNNGVSEQDRAVIPLRECLRMKANLAIFANAIADLGGLSWRLEPSSEAAGGRVIIITGTYSDHMVLHRELLELTRKAGNAEIDFLFCVPPSDVKSGPAGRFSALGNQMTGQGLEVWDGTNENARRDFPRGNESYRIVQYASCRGLEGWTVVAEGLDQFWEYRASVAARTGLSGAEPSAINPKLESAAADAWRWCMIPLTRPIDTLVISLNNLNSNFSRAIIKLAESLPDIVEMQIAPHHSADRPKV